MQSVRAAVDRTVDLLAPATIPADRIDPRVRSAVESLMLSRMRTSALPICRQSRLVGEPICPPLSTRRRVAHAAVPPLLAHGRSGYADFTGDFADRRCSRCRLLGLCALLSHLPAHVRERPLVLSRISKLRPSHTGEAESSREDHFGKNPAWLWAGPSANL